MNQLSETAENLIIVDVEYVDNVVFDLTVNFERMLERRIPKGDLPLWLDCVALDGGMKTGNNSIHIVFIHEKNKSHFDNFLPSNLAEEINGKAFADSIGEFAMQTVTTEKIASKNQLFADILQTALNLDTTKRIIAIPAKDYFDDIRTIIRRSEQQKDVTILTMESMAGGGFKQEMLGYSLLQALGIHSDEIDAKLK